QEARELPPYGSRNLSIALDVAPLLEKLLCVMELLASRRPCCDVAAGAPGGMNYRKSRRPPAPKAAPIATGSARRGAAALVPTGTGAMMPSCIPMHVKHPAHDNLSIHGGTMIGGRTFLHAGRSGRTLITQHSAAVQAS